MLKKIRNKIIQSVFKKYYSDFDYPFENADYLISKLTKEQRETYYNDVKRFYQSNLYRIEITELKKLFYKELAMNSKSLDQVIGYRLALLFIRKLENRFKYLSTLSSLEDKVDKIINTSN